MSRIAEGFVITDIAAIEKTLANHYPNLEIVQQTNFVTYGTRHGQFQTGLPGLYQLKVLLRAAEAGVDLRGVAARVGVKLPDCLGDIETSPLSQDDEERFWFTPEIKPHQQHVVRNVMSKDADFVIRFRRQHPLASNAYEIGLVRHPLRNEYAAMTDTYSNGNGLFTEQGIGALGRDDDHNDTAAIWGREFRQHYAVQAATHVFEREYASGNAAYRQMQIERQEDGSTKITICGA